MIKIKKNLCYIFAISIFSIVLFTELKAMEKESLIDKPRSKQLRKKISLTAIVEAAKKKTYNKFSNNMIQTKKELSYFEELPIELKEYILSFLPGDNRGLNYLVRCKKFFPTSVIAEKIQAAFLNRLSKIDGPLSGSLAYAAMHFFEVSKKGHINSLYHLFGDHLDLEKTIPAKVRKSSCWDTEDNSEKLTYSAIEEALKLFVNNTQSAWNELIKKLYEKNKPLISFSGFCLIRKKNNRTLCQKTKSTL